MDYKQKEIRRMVCTPGTLHVRESAGDAQASRTIEGYAILFNTPSAPLWGNEEGEAREEIAPEAVTKELLDAQDIKMTMFHDRQLILARSNRGQGTLSYHVDEKGVSFSFDAPHTADGDKALELVKRGDLAGCSFAFSTRYFDPSCVEHTMEADPDGYTRETYRVKAITGIYDFTIAADPAYPDTEVEARELRDGMKAEEDEKRRESEIERQKQQRRCEQLREMRRAARRLL